MPRWLAWGATVNNQHYDDDFRVWLDGRGESGIVAVADGVTATAGSPASFLAVNGIVYACRSLLHEPLEVERVERCAALVGRAFEHQADPRVLAAIAEAKTSYYAECCRDGRPCTRPLTFEDLEQGYKPHTTPEAERKRRIVERGTSPATTLLALILRGDHVAVFLAGDGTLFGMGKTTTDSWVMWGAMPRFAQETRLASYYEYGRGLVGEPLVFITRVQPGRLLVLATDGVDPTALYKASLEAARLLHEGADLGNVAAWILERVREEVGGFDDDATLVVAYRAE